MKDSVITAEQRAAVRVFMANDGLEIVRDCLKDAIFADLVSTSAERRASAAAAYRAIDIIAQSFRVIAKNTGDS